MIALILPAANRHQHPVGTTARPIHWSFLGWGGGEQTIDWPALQLHQANISLTITLKSYMKDEIKPCLGH